MTADSGTYSADPFLKEPNDFLKYASLCYFQKLNPNVDLVAIKECFHNMSDVTSNCLSNVSTCWTYLGCLDLTYNIDLFLAPDIVTDIFVRLIDFVLLRHFQSPIEATGAMFSPLSGSRAFLSKPPDLEQSFDIPFQTL